MPRLSRKFERRLIIVDASQNFILYLNHVDEEVDPGDFEFELIIPPGRMNRREFLRQVYCYFHRHRGKILNGHHTSCF